VLEATRVKGISILNRLGHDAGSVSGVGHESNHCAEFVLVDRVSGKEHTVQGERNVPRQSFLDGLKALMESAASPAEAERLQGVFSVEYMMRKAKEFIGSALSLFSPSDSPEKHEVPSAGVRTSQHRDAQDPPAGHSFSNSEDSVGSSQRTPAGVSIFKDASALINDWDGVKEAENILDGNWFPSKNPFSLETLLDFLDVPRRTSEALGCSDEQLYIGEAHATLHVLREMMLKPDHSTGQREYHAVLGSNRVERVKVSDVLPAKLNDVPAKPNDGKNTTGQDNRPIWEKIAEWRNTAQGALAIARWQALGVDHVILVHSHPIAYDKNGAMRTWDRLSSKDIDAVELMTNAMPLPAISYVLGPDGSVFRWKKGDLEGVDTTNPDPEWNRYGVPTLVGKFTKEGDYIPYKTIDGTQVPDSEHTVSSKHIASWSRQNNWNITDQETGGF
jgi:hypothetical protein